MYVCIGYICRRVMSRHFCDESLSRVWFACVVIYIWHMCVCVCYKPYKFLLHMDSVTFAAVQCVENQCRVQHAEHFPIGVLPTMPWCDDPNPTWTLTCRTSHSRSLSLSCSFYASMRPQLLTASLSAWVDQNSCAHCIHRRPHSTHASILQLPRMCVWVCMHVHACAWWQQEAEPSTCAHHQ